MYLTEKNLLSDEKDDFFFFFAKILFIYSTDYYLDKTLSKAAIIMVYLLGYICLTQETPGAL